MLKLTKSFYRYLRLTYENIYSRVHVKKSINLSCTKSTHTISNCLESESLLSLTTLSDQQLRHSSKIKNILPNKKSINKTNALKKLRQMSESQPTLNHVSFGGQFKITASDQNQPSSNQWRKQSSDDKLGEGAGSSAGNKCTIPPDFRFWETVASRSDKQSGATCKFKIVSYNVLAQYLLDCHPYLYKCCSSFDLKWKVRAERLYDEIIRLDPDILCLQEVQLSHLTTFYDKFEQIGYCGIFKQKTGQSHDGCSIYFRKSLFNLVDQISVEYLQPELPILNRDNIGVMVMLAPKSAPDSRFIVATTHLLYNPKRTDVRLAQMQLFLAEIDRFAYTNNEKDSADLPIILTGDFNSTPDSAVVRLLDFGQVSAGAFRDNSDWRKIGVTDDCQHLAVYLCRQRGEAFRNHSDLQIQNTEYLKQNASRSERKSNDYSCLFNSNTIRCSLGLKSVYDRVKKSGQYEATTYQDYWVTVDYIYFSNHSNLSLLQRLRLPTMPECDVLGCLPNEVYASDHLALGAVFEITPRKCSL